MNEMKERGRAKASLSPSLQLHDSDPFVRCVVSLLPSGDGQTGGRTKAAMDFLPFLPSSFIVRAGRGKETRAKSRLILSRFLPFPPLPFHSDTKRRVTMVL